MAAITGNGAPRSVAVPDSLGIEARRILTDPEGCVARLGAPDQVRLAQVWCSARSHGGAAYELHVPGFESPTHLYMLDMRRDHGVVVAVVSPADAGDEHLIEALRPPLLAARLGKATKDGTGRLTWVDDGLARILDRHAADLVGRRITDLTHPDDRELAIVGWMEMLDQPGASSPVRVRYRRRDGSWVWMEVVNTNRLDDPDHGDVLAEMVDISDRMGAFEAIRARDQLLHQLTETVHVGLFHAELGGELLYANSRLSELTGVWGAKTFSEHISTVGGADRGRLEEAVGAARAGGETAVEVEVRVHGGLRYCRFSFRPLRSGGGEVTGLTGCVEDVTEAVGERRALETKAASDHLTGCLNRLGALTLLEELLGARGSGTDQPGGTAVIFLDLDGFKPINDRFGHAAGDEALVAVADRIRSSVRSGDAVGRFGGDEFIVVCAGVTSAEQALSVASFIGARAFGEPLEIGGEEVWLRASLGVAWSAGRGPDALTLVGQADAAMYQAKRDGLTRPVLYARVA